MSRIAHAWQRWVAFLDERETGESIALFRVLTGLVTIGTALGALDADVWRLVWLDADDGGYRSLGPTWLLKLFGGNTPTNVYTFIWITFAPNVHRAASLELGGVRLVGHPHHERALSPADGTRGRDVVARVFFADAAFLVDGAHPRVAASTGVPADRARVLLDGRAEDQRVLAAHR
jgi:hypothetical protein